MLLTDNLLIPHKPPPDEKPVSETLWSLLAGLRFVLASFVVFSHMHSFLPEDWQVGCVWLANFGGLQSVYAFLVISGFSIAHSYTSSPKGFFDRRFWRIAPIYLACFAISNVPFVVWGPVVQTGSGGIEAPIGRNGDIQFILNTLCLQGWVTRPLDLFGQSWSLSVEVFFYFLTPWLSRVKSRYLFGLCATSALLCMMYCTISAVPIAAAVDGMGEITLAWAWLAGFLFYRLRNNQSVQKWLPFVLLPCSMLAQASTAVLGGVPLTGVAIVLTQCRTLNLSESARRVLNYLGSISYALYLVHLVIIYTAPAAFKNAPPFAWIILYISACAAAALLYQCIDVPLAWIRRRLKAHCTMAKFPVSGQK